MIFPRVDRFVIAVWRVIWAWVRGEDVFVDDDEYGDRVGQCTAPCEELDPDFEQCRLCSCFVRGKAMFATEKCPKKKWKNHFVYCLGQHKQEL